MKKKITFRIKKSVQTDWSKLAHSSTFEDAKAGMKGVSSKYFLRGLVGALHQLDSGFVVATPSSTPDKIKLKGKQPSKIRLLNFGVDSGVGAGYEIMMDGKKPLEIDGNVVYREKKPSEKSYDKNVINLMKILFGTDKLKPTDLHSFISLLNLTNKYTDKKVKQSALDRFLEILFGINGQAQFIEPDPEEDLKLKMGMYNKAVEMLHLKSSNKVDEYVKAYMKKVHSLSERLRRHLGVSSKLPEIVEDNNYPDENSIDDSDKKKPSKKQEKSDYIDKKETPKENKKEKEKEHKAKEAEHKEIITKLINLSLELDNAIDDKERDAIQKEMDKLDKDSEAKKREAKEYEKEKREAEADGEDPVNDNDKEEPEQKDKDA